MRTKIIAGVAFAVLFLTGVFIGFRPQITERVQSSMAQWREFKAGLDMERCVNQSDALVTLMGSSFEDGKLFLAVSVIAEVEDDALTAYATVLRCALQSPDWDAVVIIDYYFEPIRTVDDWEVHYTSSAFLGVMVERSIAEQVVAAEDPEAALKGFGESGDVDISVLAYFNLPLKEEMVTRRGVALAIERITEKMAGQAP